MGNCRCEIHFHNKEGEANLDNYNGSQAGVNSNKPLEIISEYSQLSSREKGAKLSKMKNNFKKNLPEIGENLPIKEFQKLISEDVDNYMKQNKLNYRSYIPQNISTFQSDPIKFKNNNIYYGNWNENNQMEGYGVYYINDRKILTEGVWYKGNIIFGRIFFSNGDIYEGGIKNSFPHGQGKMIFSNNEIYEGEFKNGEMSGNGKYIFSDNTEYNGQLENGYFNGRGKMKWDNGTEYEGNFDSSTLCGEGTIKNSQGDKYSGKFDKNEFNGEGIYYFNNGDEYNGNFEYGIKKGKGTYTRNDNVIFEGIWNDDLPNGNGIIFFGQNSMRGFWRNGDFVNSENEEGNNEFDNIDKNIKPYKMSIFPNSLSHLSVVDSNVSQFIPANFT